MIAFDAVVRIPVSVVKRPRDQVSDVVADLGDSATVAKIACHLKWDESKVEKVVDISRGPRVRT